MSRRSRRRSVEPRAGAARDRPEAGARGRPPNEREPGRAEQAGGRARRRDKIPLLAQVAILVAVFAATVGIAELAGAVNLGTSFGIAQIVFAIVLVFLLLRA